MTLVVNDRVQEVSTSTGSGPFVLGGGVTGYQTFSVGIGNTNSTYYTITNGTNWMDILGTYTSAANSITVDKILTSSAGGTTAVSFAAGTKNIFCTYPAATAVLAAPAAYPTIQPSLNLDFANTKQLDPRITFVRNSTAAYYDGRTSALAEQNLVTQSQTFSTWTPSGATPTANTTTAPDGTTTGASLVESATTASHNIFFTAGTVGLTYTQTVYAKANTRNWLKVVNYTTYANFDLTNGVIGSYNTAGVPTITSVGNGWYRCTMSLTTALASYMQLNVGSGNVASYIDSYVGDGTSGIYIWGAQLEQRSSATAYTPTTTAPITNYIPVLMTAPAGVARFDCDPITGKSLGLLIEESRTNLFTYSSAVGGTNWTLSQANIALNMAIAPDGTQTASKLYDNTATSYHSVNTSSITGVVSGASYTISCYVKAAEFSLMYVAVLGTAFPLNPNASYNLASGVVASSSNGTASITSIGNNWYRVILTCTATANGAISLAFGTLFSNHLGDGYSGIYIWGAQLEAGSFATSYTATLASTVTRAADNASMTGTNFSSWYNQAQGSFYCDGDFNETNPSNNTVFMEGGASNGDFTIGTIAANSSSTMRFIVRNTNTNPTGSITITYTFIVNASIKGAFIYNGLSGLTCALNGITYAGNSAVGATSIPDRIYIGSRGGGSLFLNGHIRKLSYYPVALSSASLVALTS